MCGQRQKKPKRAQLQDSRLLLPKDFVFQPPCFIWSVLGRLRSWGRLEILGSSKKRILFINIPSLLSPLLSLYSALFYSVGTQWPSSSAVSLSALQAGFHSLRSYYLSLFLFPFQTLYISPLHSFSYSVPWFFFLFPFLFLSVFLSTIQSAPLPPSPSPLSSHLSYILCTHKTSNTLEKSLSLVCSLMLALVQELASDNKREGRNRRRELRSGGGKRA